MTSTSSKVSFPCEHGVLQPIFVGTVIGFEFDQLLILLHSELDTRPITYF